MFCSKSFNHKHGYTKKRLQLKPKIQFSKVKIISSQYACVSCSKEVKQNGWATSYVNIRTGPPQIWTKKKTLPNQMNGR